MANISHLPERYQRCIVEYLHCLNMSTAYHRVYGGDKKTAQSNAYVVFNKPEVKEALQSIINERLMTDSEVLLRLQELAQGKIGEYIKEDLTVDKDSLYADGKSYLLQSIRPTKYGDEIKFYDYQKAVETVAKLKGLFDERDIVNVTVNQETLESKIETLKKRLNDSSI